MTFQDHIVWITGASSGIGEALAHEMASRGARLVLSARREAELERVRSEIERSDEHLVLPLDLTEEETHAGAVARVLDRFGRVDVMVHNGGISQRSLVKETSFDVDRRILEVDYLGTVSLTKALLPSMIERGAGRFVVVSSLVGYVATPYRSAYSAAKHALHGFFEALRAELYDDGIRVTMICPGYIRTRVSHNALTADGTPQGTMDRVQAEGMDPTKCARRIVRAVARGKPEAYIGGWEKYSVYIRRWCPPLYRWLVRRISVV